MHARDLDAAQPGRPLARRTPPLSLLSTLRLMQVFPPDRLHELLGQADYVVLALPGTSDTARVIDAAALAAMKPSAVIVNIGRGTSIDQDALIAGAPAWLPDPCSVVLLAQHTAPLAALPPGAQPCAL